MNTKTLLSIAFIFELLCVPTIITLAVKTDQPWAIALFPLIIVAAATLTAHKECED